MKISLHEATASQLAEYATAQLGIECNYRDGRDKILAKMSSVGFNSEFIEAEAETAPEPKAAIGAVEPKGPRKMVRIMIPTQNEPGGKDPVVVGVNGRVARIMRGKPVDVPAEYVEVLNNANKLVYDKDENGSPINPQLVPTHPFSILVPSV